jgi:hypothetical protein
LPIFLFLSSLLSLPIFLSSAPSLHIFIILSLALSFYIFLSFALSLHTLFSSALLLYIFLSSFCNLTTHTSFFRCLTAYHALSLHIFLLLSRCTLPIYYCTSFSLLFSHGWVEINLSNICQHPYGHLHKPLG